MCSASDGVVRFLHITDCHLSKNDQYDTIDRKTPLPGTNAPSRADVLHRTLEQFASHLSKQHEELHGVLFSGDGAAKGDQDGQKILRDLLLETLGKVGITSDKIVASPGNHDITKGSPPSSPERYRSFTDAWAGNVRPFLDGIDFPGALPSAAHFLKAPDNTWAVFPINTANWCQLKLNDEQFPGLDKLRELASQAQLDELLNDFVFHDVARVSPDQMDFLKSLVESLGEIQLRIAVLHHPIVTVGTREEFKTFSDLTNLGALRQVLRELDFHVVLHGHKHESALSYDHIYPDHDLNAPAHRLLAISGGTFDPAAHGHGDPMRLIEIAQARHAPLCSVTRIPLVECGRQLRPRFAGEVRIWEEGARGHGPIVIEGNSVTDVYERAIQVADNSTRPLICVLNLPQNEELPIPDSYPSPSVTTREWFEDTVKWWQQPFSRNEDRIPYVHGSRLRRFGGWLNQIERAIKVLKEGQPTTKAIAFAIDPARDLAGDKPFASFCFVHFCLRERKVLDCIGYYRTQEFKHWWPVNLAELRSLQLEIASEAMLTPGLITTISADPRLSQGKQPTKVAVPLIDQWVDNHPGRIAMIAQALTGHDTLEGVKYWRACLDDIRQGTLDYPPRRRSSSN